MKESKAMSVKENPTAEWLFWDDFEEDNLHKYFEYTHAEKYYRSRGDGIGGSTGLRVDFKEGDVEAGSLKLAFGRTHDDSYCKSVAAAGEYITEIYSRYYVRYDEDWEGGGGDKMSRFTALHDGWAQSMIAHTWSMGDCLGLDPASGIDINDSGTKLVTRKYNDFDRLAWQGAKPSKTPIFDAKHIGQWYAAETHIKLNTPGKSDGVFEL